MPTPWDDLTDGSVFDIVPDLGGGEDAAAQGVEYAKAQFAITAREDAWREINDDEADYYEHRFNYDDGATVRGEVVDNTATGPLPDPPAVDGPTEHDPAPRRGQYSAPPPRPRNAPPRYEPPEDPYADRFEGGGTRPVRFER